MAVVACAALLAACAGAPPAADTAGTATAQRGTPDPLNSLTTGKAAGGLNAASGKPPAGGEGGGRDWLNVQQSDIWDRIRRGFAMPDTEGTLVDDRTQWYAQRPEYMERMISRSSRYLYHIVEELERRNMPTELALLPFVESAFNPQAESSAKAAGMWQFIPSTGKTYKLKQNMFRDERRDVLASTDAALDYGAPVRHVRRLAAGAGGLQLGRRRRVARDLAQPARGLPTDYASLSMPNETRYYVPKLQAVKNIISNPELYGIKLPDIPDHPYFVTVTTSRDIDVALAISWPTCRWRSSRRSTPPSTAR